MSVVSSFNQFPAHQDSTGIALNMNSIKLAFLMWGLIQILLVHVFDARKRISSFLSGFQPRLIPRASSDHPVLTHEPSAMQEMKSGNQSVSRTDVEVVFRSLGMVSNGRHEPTRLPSRIGADDLFAMFEDKNAGLDEVKEAFDVFDNNRDGFIDATDLQRVLCRLGLKEGSDMEKCRRMIGVFDENGDGRMDFGEFVKLMENSFD